MCLTQTQQTFILAYEHENGWNVSVLKAGAFNKIALLVSLLQHRLNVLQLQIFRLEQDQEVIEQVSCFVPEQIYIVILRFYYQLHSFFSHLLCYFVDTATEKCCGIGSFRFFGDALFNHLLQLVQKTLGCFFLKAGGAAGVTGRPLWICFDQ